MNKRRFMLNRKIERSLWENSLNPEEDEHLSRARVNKTISKLVFTLVMVPLVAIGGAMIIWLAVRVLSGMSGGLAGVN
jgi:hypothetical protein